MQMCLEATALWFYRRNIRIQWAEHVSLGKVLRKIDSKKILRIIKCQLAFLGHNKERRIEEFNTDHGIIGGMFLQQGLVITV